MSDFINSTVPGINLWMCPANDRRRYIVTSSLIGWAHTPNDPCCAYLWASTISTLRPRQNGRYVTDNISKCIILNENVWISLNISLKFVHEVWMNNIPVLVQIMAWRWPGDKPLSEPMVVKLLTHLGLNEVSVRSFADTVMTNFDIYIHIYIYSYHMGQSF